MSIPTLLKGQNRPNSEEIIIDLLESIAKEELALSQLITSESIKINAFIGKELDFPTQPTTAEIIKFNYSVNKLMDTILMKDWLLLKKLETVSQIKTALTTASHCCNQEQESCCDHQPLKGEENE